MSRASDVARVLKGVALIADHLIKKSNHDMPEITRKVERVQYHVTELVKTIIDYRTDIESHTRNTNRPKSASSPNSSASESTKPYVVNENFKNFTSSPTIDYETKPQTSESHEFSSEATLSESNVAVSTSVERTTVNPPSDTMKSNADKTSDDLIGFPLSSSSNSHSSQQSQETVNSNTQVDNDIPKSSMRARAVPSSQLARMWGFGSLAARMVLGVATDSASKVLGVNSNNESSSISDANAERLAEALCRMRGAALKLGQMLSLQDDGVLPPALSKALDRVRQAADYMPLHQLHQQLRKELGENWRELFDEFDEMPIAAASIGQVHRAKLAGCKSEVAIKIQYPGVADSIESDLQNLKRLVTIANILPPGLYIDQIIKVANEELAQECDYKLEAVSQMKYRQLILDDKVLRKHVNVPEVFEELSTSRLLTSRLVPGVAIDKAISLSQDIRNAIARTVLITTIRELFEWRLIQSDPNFGNFLYDNENRMINMIDFGAARVYRKEFVDGYMRLVWAAANSDRETIVTVSKDLGFLTGDESSEMLFAHVETGLVVGEPFLKNDPFDFANSNLTKRISHYGNVFMKYRLTAPPTEAYSLHRKLAGAFLLCIKLKAVIKCRDILEDTYKAYTFTI